MAVTPSLSILNSIEVTTITGATFTEYQGEFEESSSEPLELTTAGVPFTSSPAIVGTCHHVPFTLATATVVTIWDDDDDKPADFDFMWIKCDQDFYIQVIGSATCLTIKCLAFVPFTMTYDSILAAANTTAITGGSEPSVTDVDSIIIGNYSGSTLTGVFVTVD